MAVIIDRRNNSKHQTLKNRGRFIEIHKKQIQESVEKILRETSIVNPSGSKKRISVRPTTEPTFRNDPKTGDRKYILPGNRKYVVGDKEPKPKSQDGSGGGREGSMDGEGDDDFVFDLSADEFMDFVFDNLELPDLVKKQLKDAKTHTLHRSGYRTAGTPTQMDLIRSTKNALGRRIGLGRPSFEKIEALRREIEEEKSASKKCDMEKLLASYEKKRAAIPWIDPFDVKYRNFTLQPKPRTKALMICVMDVSFSMTEDLKKLAKSFFMLLNLFLKRKYEQVDIIFIKHHSIAAETDEHDFFYGTDSGGTVVSTAFTLANEIIRDRYPLEDWNVYCAQASDGDNANNDMSPMKVQLEKLLTSSQYFAYVETTDSTRWRMQGSGPGLWSEYKPIAAQNPKLNMRKVSSEKDVWTVFTELFHKDVKNVKTSL